MKRPRKRRQERKKYYILKREGKVKRRVLAVEMQMICIKKEELVEKGEEEASFARNKKMSKSLTREKEKEESRVNREMERRDGGGYDRNEKYKKVERRYQTVKKEVKERIRKKIEMLRKEYEKREERWREERERI